MKKEKLYLHKNGIPGMLLDIALDRFGVDISQFVCWENCNDVENLLEPAYPRAIYIQPGGMNALLQLGVPVNKMGGFGQNIQKLRVLDEQGKILFLADHGLIEKGFPGMIVKTKDLKELLREHIPREQGLHNREKAPPPALSWKIKQHCSGVLLRIVRGDLKTPTESVIYNGEEISVWISQVVPGEILFYVTKRFNPAIKKNSHVLLVNEEHFCKEKLREVSGFYEKYVNYQGEVLEEQWFELDFIGQRQILEKGNIYWGIHSLRLHPLTGQFISHWAGQAEYLASALASRKYSPEQILAKLQQKNKQIFQQHLQIIKYYMRPTIFWKLIYHPNAFLLRHSQFFLRRALARFALLD